jgi:hypothetical protein
VPRTTFATLEHVHHYSYEHSLSEGVFFLSQINHSETRERLEPVGIDVSNLETRLTQDISSLQNSSTATDRKMAIICDVMDRVLSETAVVRNAVYENGPKVERELSDIRSELSSAQARGLNESLRLHSAFSDASAGDTSSVQRIATFIASRLTLFPDFFGFLMAALSSTQRAFAVKT